MSIFSDKNKNKIGSIDGNEITIDGRVVGKVKDNELFDKDGKIIGRVVNGEILDPDGRPIPDSDGAWEMFVEDEKSAMAAAAWSLLKKNNKL